MGIQTAVAPGVRTPGFYLLLNFLAGELSTASGPEKILISGPAFSTGDITDDTEVRRIFGADGAAQSHGAGNPVHLAAQAIFRAYGNAEVWVGAPAEAAAGVAATATATFTGSATVATVVGCAVAGFEAAVPWNVGETATQFVTRAVTFMNALNKGAMPVTCSSGAGAGEMDIDANGPGTWGNDIAYRFRFLKGGTGVGLPAAANLSAGTTEPDWTNLLAAVAERSFIHLPCLSNADIILGASGGLRDFRTHIETYIEGLNAKLQAVLVGFTGSVAAAITAATAQNMVFGEMVALRNAEMLPCELAAAELADTLAGLDIRANYNRINNVLPEIRGAYDETGDRFTETEVEALLQGGVTPLQYNENTSDVYVVRPVTMHSQTASGNPDDRCYNISDMWGGRAVARDIMVALPEAFPNASVTEDLPPGTEQELPPGVVERREIELWILTRVEIWIGLGVVDRTRFDAKVASGEFAVEIDETDPSQVNFALPTPIVKPLAKFSGVHNNS